MSYYRMNRAGDFAQYLRDNLSVERASRYLAHCSLLGATAFGALGFFENGHPSQSEQSEIYACADQLGEKPRNSRAEDVPSECAQYEDEFGQPEDDYFDYVLPPSDEFLDDKIWTSHLEEERERKFGQSFLFLSFALGGYAISSFCRRLDNPEPSVMIEEAENFLRGQSKQE